MVATPDSVQGLYRSIFLRVIAAQRWLDDTTHGKMPAYKLLMAWATPVDRERITVLLKAEVNDE